MSQLIDIKKAQDSLEECFSKRMAELEAQLQTGGPDRKDTVAKVAEEFRAFREIIFAMLNVLRKQINECSQYLDLIETRHRRKYLIFLGISEAEKDSRAAILPIIQKLGITETSSTVMSACYRIGTISKEHHRPILVKFHSIDTKSAVWRAKTRLKGSSVSMREFLTRSRQLVFVKAREHFGMRLCWTQEGVIVVKAADNKLHKISTMDQLQSLIKQHPKAVGTDSHSTKSRK